MEIGLIFEIIANYNIKWVWKNVLTNETYNKYYPITIRYLAAIKETHLTLEIKIKEIKLQAIVNSKA